MEKITLTTWPNQKEKRRQAAKKASQAEEMRRNIGLLAVCGGIFLCGRFHFLGWMYPFGFGALGALGVSNMGILPGVVSLAAAVLLEGNHRIKYLGALACFAFLHGLVKKRRLRWALPGISLFFAGVVQSVLAGGSQFYLMAAFFEGVLAVTSSILASGGVSFLAQGEKKEGTGLSLCAFFAVSLCGLLSFLPFSEALLYFLVTLCSLLGVWAGEAAAGEVLGLILWLCGQGDLLLFAVSCGHRCVGGFFQKGGPWMLAVVHFSVAVLMLVFAQEADLILCGAVGAGCLVFLLAAAFLPRQEEAPSEVLMGADSGCCAAERLQKQADACLALAKVLPIPQQEEEKPSLEMTMLAERAARESCSQCPHYEVCWKDAPFLCYSASFYFLQKMEEKDAGAEDFPPEFLEKCLHPDAFAQSLKRQRNILRQEKEQKALAGRSLGLIREHFRMLGDILSRESVQFARGRIALPEEEERLRVLLSCAGIGVSALSVFEEKGRGRTAILTFPTTVMPPAPTAPWCKKMEKLLRDAMQVPMRFSPSPAALQPAAKNVLVFRQEPPFLLAAAADMEGAEEDVCGDSMTFFSEERGAVLLALSDGMGRGKQAKTRADRAVELAESFFCAGFGLKELAEMINTTLLFEEEEGFVTLDLCSVDLFSGKASFLKYGGTATFLLRGERVLTLTGLSLPVGILENPTPLEQEFLLKNGDVILLCSDGITDAFGGVEETAEWLKKHCDEVPLGDPERTAKWLKNGALSRYRQDEKRDDMTVVAGRFWER